MFQKKSLENKVMRKRLILNYIWSFGVGLSIKPTYPPESAALIEAYYKNYPRLKSYIQEQIDFAREMVMYKQFWVVAI
jgi:hypothetical protein